MDICNKKDTIGEGHLRMDDLREAYYQYKGRYTDKDEIDAILMKCTISMAKKGMIQILQFVKIVSIKNLDQIKQRIKKAFAIYEERRAEVQDIGFKKGLISKDELKKMIRCIMRSNNNQSDALVCDCDKDQDGYLSLEEIINFIVSLCSH